MRAGNFVRTGHRIRWVCTMRRALKDVEILVVLLSAPFAVSLQPLKPTTPKPQLPELSSYVESADNYCIVSDELPEFARQDYYIDALLFSVPAVVPFFSFFAYPVVQRVYHASLDILSGRTWYAVDGGASRVFDLLPVTNGIVVPSVSVAFGTLTAITIQTLRQRQISICAALNKESCALRNLHAACRTVFADAAYDRERLQTNVLLGEYCTRLIFESRLGVDLDVLERVGASDSELDGITEVLYGARDLPRDDQSQRLFLQNTGFTAMNLVRDLQLFRSERLALLQVPFPAVHWLILSVLASSIVLAYLFETDLQVRTQACRTVRHAPHGAVPHGAVPTRAVRCVPGAAIPRRPAAALPLHRARLCLPCARVPLRRPGRPLPWLLHHHTVHEPAGMHPPVHSWRLRERRGQRRGGARAQPRDRLDGSRQVGNRCEWPRRRDRRCTAGAPRRTLKGVSLGEFTN